MSLRAKIKAIVTLGRGITTELPSLQEAPDPIVLFGEWFQAAGESGLLLSETMTLATATADGTPSARAVLLKRFDDRGFVFFTNYGSRKSRELEENSRVALSFHWAVLQRQVRIEGTAEKISEDESAAYFRTRGRGSQIGAWASRQSDPLPDRETLERRAEEHVQRFAGQDIPLPPFWGGYRVTPIMIEFWQGRLDRLHDRIRYRREGDGWTVDRLYP